MARNRPSGNNIIAIILGASTFPAYETLETSPAFAASAEAFRNYLRTRLNLPDSHILPLFDNDAQPGEQLKLIKDFIKQRLEGPELTDVIFYYCGHGTYLDEDEYALALKCTDMETKEATVFKVSYLAGLIADLTSGQRNLVVLDACYSGAALGEFVKQSEGNAAADVTQKFYDAVPNPEKDEMPDEPGGAILFCAAGPKKWAKTPLEARLTMFSGALSAALEEGDPKGGPDLTVKRLAQLVNAKIKQNFGLKAVKPQVHVPVQGESDLLESPFFPNPAFGAGMLQERMQKAEERLQKAEERLQKGEGRIHEAEEHARKIEAEAGQTKQDVSTLKAKSSESALSYAGPFYPTDETLMGRTLRLIRQARTPIVCLAVDVLTFYALKWSMISGDSDVFVTIKPHTIIGVAHILVLLFSLAVVSAPHLKPSRLQFILQEFPGGISYAILALNSSVVLVAIVWMSQLPFTTVATLFNVQQTTSLSPIEIVKIQRALCLPPTGRQDAETQAGLRNYLKARNYPLDASIVTYANFQLFGDALEAVPNCDASEFKTAFEVGTFAVPKEKSQEKIGRFQERLSDFGKFTATGVLDASTRTAIADYRRRYDLTTQGDTVDAELLAKLGYR